jgi:hypothetical protein
VNIPITTTYSIYWLLLVFGLVGVVSYTLYYKKIVKSDLTAFQSLFLTSLRFLFLFFIGFLLLSPILKIVIKQNQKPVIILAQDNSKSMVLTKDSTFVRNTLRLKENKLIDLLSDIYDVREMQFGSKVKDSLVSDFSDKESNFEELFNEFNTTYFNQNIGALIIVSDGIYNRGADPVNISKNLDFPIYTVAVGDTVPGINLAISKIEYNKVSYKGTKFPIVVGVKADFLKGKKLKIEIIDNQKVIGNKIIDINIDNFFKKEPFVIEANKTGVFEYKVRVSLLKSDKNKALEVQKKIYVEVEESKRKILLLQNSPHPDIAVFKQIVDSNPTFKIDVKSPDKFNGNIKDYTLVILHQLPSVKYNLKNILSDLMKYDIPILFVFGEKSSIEQINNLNLFLNIKQKHALYDDVLATVNSDFSLFNVDIADIDIVDMPPLYVHFGEYKTIFNDNILLYQKVGDVKTNKPLWLFTESGKQKIGFILGEGIWKWHLLEYKESRSHFFTEELITKTINYLAIKNRIAPIVLEYSKVEREGHDVVFKAKLFNKSNEFIENANVDIDIFDSDGNKYSSVFKNNEGEYEANLGSLEIGKYKFEVTYKKGENKIVKKGDFIVIENISEQLNLLADYNLLYRLSKNTGGELVKKEDVLTLKDKIEQNTKISTLEYSTKSVKELVDIKWILFILLIIITMEWFFRKFWGIV